MKALLATTVIVSGTLLAGGCATKKYVRNTAAPIQAKVEQVGDQTNQNTQQIDDTRKQVKQVDDRAQAGISAAQERASTADQHAGEAMKSAQEAGNRATQATQMAQQNAQDLGSLRQVVANIDDYKLQTSISVPFKFDQATLSKEAQADLDKLAGDIKSGKRFFIAVEGYTDNVGDRQYNDNLSRRRADAVMKYLVSKHDIPVYRLQMIGLGKDKPVDDARTREARAKNRRVEVKVFSADQVTASLGQGQSQNNSQGSSANRQQ